MEVWKSVINFEGLYMISNLGNVKSLDRLDSRGRNIKGRPMKLKSDKDGYLEVKLMKDGKSYHHRVHRLVAMAFIKRIDGKNTVNHINGIKNDNRFENLEWCTISENTLHAFEKLGRKGNNGNMNKRVAKLDPITETTIKEFNSITEASSEMKLDKTAISRCLNGKSKTSGGYKWKFIK